MALGDGGDNRIGGVSGGVPPTTPTLRVVEKNLDGTATTPTANNVFSLRNASVGPKTIPTLGIELNKLFENLSDPRFNKIQTLLPEEPLFPQNLDLLEGTKFYTDDAIVTKHKDTLSATEKGLEDVQAQISAGEEYVDLEKPKLTVVLPSRFLSSPIEGLSALDWVAASINHLTKDWKEKPFAIDVKINGDNRNPILTESALDIMAAKHEKYPTGWTYTLLRPTGSNGYKAGLLQEAVTEDDYRKIPSVRETDGLRRVLDKTMLTQEGKYATELGELGMVMNPVMLSSGIFLLSSDEGRNVDYLRTVGYLSSSGDSEKPFDTYYRLHQENGKVISHKAHFNPDLVRVPRDGSVFLINRLNSLARPLLAMFDVSHSFAENGSNRMDVNNYRPLEIPVLGTLADAFGFINFLAYGQHLREVRTVDRPNGTDPYVLSQITTERLGAIRRKS